MAIRNLSSTKVPNQGTSRLGSTGQQFGYAKIVNRVLGKRNGASPRTGGSKGAPGRI